MAQQKRMTLDVVVTDKSGKPVTGLQTQDFTLLDNKQPRTIASFQAIEAAAKTAQPAEIVLVVDEVNTSFPKVAVAVGEIGKFLRRNGGALARPVSLAFLSDSGLALPNAPSQDGNTLLAEISRQDFSLRTLDKPRLNAANDLAQTSLRALGQLIDYEAKRPGRKLVVWISPGWPFVSDTRMEVKPKDKEAFFNYLVALSDGLRRARIALYEVDPMGAAGTAGLRTGDYAQFLKAARTAGQVQNGYLALQVLAFQSGGRALVSNNDMEGEIASCVDDANEFYTLSFDAAAGTSPNEYHSLEIKLGKPGLAVHTLAGYYAQPERH